MRVNDAQHCSKAMLLSIVNIKSIFLNVSIAVTKLIPRIIDS